MANLSFGVLRSRGSPAYTRRRRDVSRGGGVTQPQADAGSPTRDAGSLQDIRSAAPSLSADERACIVEQALLLLEDLYVHLPLKRAMHATDPVQALRLLGMRNANLS